MCRAYQTVWRKCLIGILCIPGMGQAFAEVSTQAKSSDVKRPFETDVILVKVKDNKGQQKKFERILEENGLKQKKKLKSISGWHILQLKDHGNARSMEARMRGLQKRMDKLRKSGQFLHVEMDAPIQIQQTLPTDAYFSNGELWGLQNTGQNSGIAGVDVNAVPAWAITTGSTSVVVAVIDTGIRYTHQDLSGNMWQNTGETAANGIDEDGNGFIDDIYGINAVTGTGNPMDDHGHGSHVAGTIGATAFNSGSHVGVAHDVQLMALKALDSAGYGTASYAISCIDYAITKGANVINASWGDTAFSQALKDSISAANSAGILFVAAAGNSGLNNDFTPFYPASYDLPNVLSVAAVDRTGARAYFSNYGGSTVDLAAPGVAILSSTSNSDSSYGYKDGTSMASPHVAGVAALLLSQHPSAGIYELTTRLLQTTTPIAGLNGYTLTGGIVNAEAALLLSSDGNMEFLAQAERGALIDGEINTLSILVTDLSPVTGATVTAYLDGYSTVPFLDNGIAPDELADDAIYTANLLAPTGVSSINLNITADATGKNTSMETVSFKVISPPANDDFEDSILLSNSVETTTGTNVESTLQPGEPLNPVGAGSHSVWWKWIPDISGQLTISTEGSGFDTTLAVYSGTTLESIVLLEANDDKIGLRSAVDFIATAGQTYMIQVNGFSYETGTIQLNYGTFTVGPPNDDFDDRIVLESGTIQTSINSTNGSSEPGEPENYYGATIRSSVWWEWVAPSSDPATITTAGSSYDTVLAVYTGSSLGSLVLKGINNPYGGYDSVTLENPTPGTSYIIQVYDDYFDSAGAGTVVLNYPDPQPPVVANDYFAQRIILAPGTTQASGSNVGATLELDEPGNPTSAGSHSVWWEWVAPISGPVAINTTGSDFDTTMAVYTGDLIASLTLIAENDDATGQQSEVSFFAVQGKSYIFQINGSGIATGNIKINYPSPGYPKPVNDDFDDRIFLTYGSSQALGTNLGASLEGGEPVNPTGAGANSVWWEWVAADSTPISIDTFGSDFDTTLAIYTGTSLGDLTLVGDNNDASGTQSSVNFTPVATTRYFIQVNGNGSATGPITLNYPTPGVPSPDNDDFAERILLPPGSIRILGSNESATTETGEPTNPPEASGLSIWYEWISPFTGPATIDTIDSSFDTTLAIYTGSVLNSLTLVGSSDDYFSYFSSVTFSATAGTSYIIQVDGDDDILEEGLVVLNYPMPWPVSVTPGRLRLSGSSGGSTAGSISILNADSIPVDFTITSGDGWLTPVPSAGTIPAGTQTLINLATSPLPAFSDSLETSLDIGLTHPSVSNIQIPIEIIQNSLVVDIPDVNLRRIIELHLGRLPDEPIAEIEMQALWELDGTGRSISNLTGLRHALNLWYLFLGDNQISDLTQVGSLNSLFILDLNNNNIHDISVLDSLPNLLDVDLRLNYLDTNTGSDDLAVINNLAGFATVYYLPQKTGMITFTDWAISLGIDPGSGWLDTNGPLELSNIFAYSMGLNPFTATGTDLPRTTASNLISSAGTDLSGSKLTSNANLFTLTYYRNTRASGITTSILTSYDLINWTPTIPVRYNVIWDDGNGHQLVEAVFEDSSSKLFFSLDVTAY